MKTSIHISLAVWALSASIATAASPKPYLIHSRVAFQRCQTRLLVAEAGTFAMPDEPGLGPSLDEARMERV